MPGLEAVVKNEYEVHDGTVELIAYDQNGKRHFVLCDECDLPLVSRASKWSIQFRPKRDKLYARSSFCGRWVSMHRLIMDCPDDMVVDHQSGDTLDNRRDNLRVVTARENSASRLYLLPDVEEYPALDVMLGFR